MLGPPNRPSNLSIPRHRSHEDAFIFCEAFCLFVVVSNRGAFWILFDVAAIGFIGLDAGETEERHRDIFRARFTYAGKAEGRRGWSGAGDEIAMVRAAVFLN